jgi:uncharacterized protein YuzE
MTAVQPGDDRLCTLLLLETKIPEEARLFEVSYDVENPPLGMLYIGRRDGIGRVSRTVELPAPESLSGVTVLLDLDQSGEIVGVEVIGIGPL